jgi:uroporphyrinogen-III decarboxylase
MPSTETKKEKPIKTLLTMTNSKERVWNALNHRGGTPVPVDFGATTVTGIHCRIVEQLRKYYGLADKPVRIVDPFQMLGEVDEELQERMGVDLVPLFGQKNMFGIDESEVHEQVTPWGQKVLIAKGIDMTPDAEGDVYIYPEGDRSVSPSAVMPEGCYFINAIERQQPIDEALLSYQDNLEEYALLNESDLAYWKQAAGKAAATGKAVVAGFGGTALGDVAFIPAMGLKHPKGIRSVAEWYMSTLIRPDFVHALFEHQTDLAIRNYEMLWNTVGDQVDVVFTCGTDFGTQDSQFCSEEVFRELWLPYYKRLNDWIHTHTTWKIFKHSCGAVLPLIPAMIDSGFDILNPVQINAKDMDSKVLKEQFGDQLVFWGGGIDTQRVLAFGTKEEVRRQVMEQCEILGKDGGFVFNTVHNIQANVPVENVITMIETLNEIRR